MFITETDLTENLPQETLTAAIRGNQNRITNAINNALSTIRAYIGGKYDCDYLFSQTGENRHALIKDAALSIASWHIVSKGLNPRNIPEIQQTLYDQAISNLKNMANDKSNADLPLIQQTQKSTRVKLSPGNKKSYRW